MVSWERLAQATAKSVEEVQSAAAAAFVREELSRLDAEEVRLAQRYGVASAADLEALMQQHLVDEYPSWEDLITWEAIGDRRRLLAILKEFVADDA